MVRQEVAIGLIFCRQHNLLTLDTSEMLGIVFLRLALTQGRGEADGIVVGRYGDKSFVESIVIERRETNAVAGIQTIFLVRLVCPGDDVAG